MSILTTTLAVLGAVTLGAYIYKLSTWLHLYFIRPNSLPRYLHTSPCGQPAWALITGASSGIGLGYAHALASSGFNLILHGRNFAKLSCVSSSIKSQYPKTQIRLMVLDATTCSASDIETAVRELKDLHITALINNVGTGTTPSGHVFAPFQDEEPLDIDAIFNTNARFPALLTHFMLPVLAEPALILTMGSISQIGSPYISVYSGTKAFDAAFSKSLRRELIAEKRQIEVLTVMTGSVTGTGGCRDVVTWGSPGAGPYARSALGRVGCGREEVWGCWAHSLIAGFVGIIGTGVLDGMVIGDVRRGMEEVGKRKAVVVVEKKGERCL